mmetsp:Transcript_16274/g.47577  ORF Transcript_16274/g.47577 Transcript_16274/m.47577 type:complete len:216 (+) Transcript_16274:381-1028(+)
MGPQQKRPHSRQRCQCRPGARPGSQDRAARLAQGAHWHMKLPQRGARLGHWHPCQPVLGLRLGGRTAHPTRHKPSRRRPSPQVRARAAAPQSAALAGPRKRRPPLQMLGSGLPAPRAGAARSQARPHRPRRARATSAAATLRPARARKAVRSPSRRAAQAAPRSPQVSAAAARARAPAPSAPRSRRGNRGSFLEHPAHQKRWRPASEDPLAPLAC